MPSQNAVAMVLFITRRSGEILNPHHHQTNALRFRTIVRSATPLALDVQVCQAYNGRVWSDQHLS